MNLKLYESIRKVPPEAQKIIGGGRLKGMTDINPMWRIKVLTEQFGPCGIGWYYEITDKRMEKGFGEEVSVFVDINLYINVDGRWSAAIPGTGGSMFVSKDKNGHYTSDECFKMATTDALSVACKSLGMGADVYWDKDATKYSPRVEKPTEVITENDYDTITNKQMGELNALCLTDKKLDQGKVDILSKICDKFGYTNAMQIKRSHYDEIKQAFKQELDELFALPFEL